MYTENNRRFVSSFRFAVCKAVDKLRGDAINHRSQASTTTGETHCAHRQAEKMARDKAALLTSALYR